MFSVLYLPSSWLLMFYRSWVLCITNSCCLNISESRVIYCKMLSILSLFITIFDLSALSFSNIFIFCIEFTAQLTKRHKTIIQPYQQDLDIHCILLKRMYWSILYPFHSKGLLGCFEACLSVLRSGSCSPGISIINDKLNKTHTLINFMVMSRKYVSVSDVIKSYFINFCLVALALCSSDASPSI